MVTKLTHARNNETQEARDPDSQDVKPPCCPLVLKPAGPGQVSERAQ
jgi:hypothetical protein